MATGVAEGLYKGDELSSGAIRDKESKLNYLGKIAACVSICIGKNVDMRGPKVV